MIDIKHFFDGCVKSLLASGVQQAKTDAELIFCHVLEVKRGKLKLLKHLTKKQAKKIKKLINKRKKHIPVQYIIKNVEFLNLKLSVNKNVLIPRNETEHLADLIIEKLTAANLHDLKVLDMCTGSGALGLGVAKNTKSFVTLSDVSKKALLIAKKNAKINNITNVEFVKGDLFEKITNTYNVFVCNPPYIKTSHINQLEKQVKNFEPKLALDGGESGLEFYKKIIIKLPQFLAPNALVFFEVGKGQHEQVANFLKQSNFAQVEVVKDYYNVNRFVIAKKN